MNYLNRQTFFRYLTFHFKNVHSYRICRCSSSSNKIRIEGKEYISDHMTNVTPRILCMLDKKLHLQHSHPLNLIYRRIVNFMYKYYINPRGNPLFSVYDNLNPVVTIEQNFDSLLVPSDHVSRQKRDNYYINENCLLRAHTTAHQAELIKSGLDNFLMVGDVYRRDEIDSSHYPVFHQLDAVRLLNKHDVVNNRGDISDVSLFESRTETKQHQNCHSNEAVKVLSDDLQSCLSSLAVSLFGKEVEWRWVDAYFPFTHPSWELEVKLDDKWVEILGCGIIRQEILVHSGAAEKIGWAFGIGLERVAMKLYGIPDIRIFWSTDSRFLSQFDVSNPESPVSFKPFSSHPPCTCDISFWLPSNGKLSSADFYDLVRNIGEDLVEKVELVDEFKHPKTGLESHCYRITYRSWERALSQKEVNKIHEKVAETAVNSFGVKIR